VRLSFFYGSRLTLVGSGKTIFAQTATQQSVELFFSFRQSLSMAAVTPKSRNTQTRKLQKTVGMFLDKVNT
jgi:hypothetical protein